MSAGKKEAGEKEDMGVVASAGVDIIILSFNRADETIAAIDSALAQRGLPVQVLVFDQGSAPDQLEKLVAFCADKPVRLELGVTNIGVAAGRNRCTAMGQAPYIIALDNDAVFSDTQMARRAVDYLKAHPDLGAIGFQILNFFTGDRDDSSWGYPAAIRDRWQEKFDTVKFVGAGHAIVRKHFEAVGGYDERLFFAWEESDLCFRFINMGLKIRYVPDVKIAHKVSPEKRVSWDGGRYYYIVRNRLYLYGKYGTPIPVVLAYALGYLVKGVANGVWTQVPRAVLDALKMIARFNRETPDKTLCRLSPAAKAYIAEHDTKLRGGLGKRLRKELLGKLDGGQRRPAAALRNESRGRI